MVSAILFAVLLVIGAAAPALAQAPTLPDLPAAIKPGDLKPYLALYAKGAQIYACRKADNGAWTWAFKGPEAELFDAAGKSAGKHYGGPTWEADGGKVVGALKASADAPVANAIPWLWLDIKSREGTGVLTQAAGILRVATVGGRAPADGCDEAHGATELRVAYGAAYYFVK